jgi:nucleoside-diphosphate-sugar epimerase
MRVVIVGGTGHIGTYLVPRLVETGHEVVVISRGLRPPYHPNSAWKKVEMIRMDREAAESAGTFGQQIQDLRPEVVVDLVCFRLDSAQMLVESLRGQVRHFLHCGTIWVHGHSTVVPATEDLPRRSFGKYGIRKAAIEDYLLGEARVNRFPVTILHPGHIVGPGWVPLNPQGNFNPEVYAKLACGEELTIPNLGLETVHHVHADDVAQAFQLAMSHWGAVVGESFHVVSPAALSLRGFAEIVASWFSQPARLRFIPWEQWKDTVSERDREDTWDHIAHSPNACITKAQRRMDYQPRYTSSQAVRESVQWLIERSLLAVT